MKLHHIALTVRHLSTSIVFYQDIFRFKEIKRFYKEDLGATGVWLQGENGIIELFQFDNCKEGNHEDLSVTGLKHIAFTLSDEIKIFREKIMSRGIIPSDIVIGASGGQYFFFTDPDGNQIEIYKEIAK